jgi:polyribonucleotide nucleotidyltransferase
VQLKDLEETARLGYSQGVSNIFINGLNELEVNKRPIHCSDGKRETLYIKDQDEWIKEDPLKTHITKAIKTVSNKNIQQIFEWQKKYPEYKDPESRQSDKYMEMICNTMSGSSKEEQEKNIEKIVKNITKEVVIDKSLSV